jgi:AcrR family transcriptional regulator
METARATKDRLLAAATTLFAQRGFHGTTARDIARHAGVNLAAGNYHYGSKKALYLQVLRAQFAEIRGQLARRGASRPPSELARLSEAAIVDLLRTRVGAMLDMLVGPAPALHGALMQREMTDPSDALPVIVEEFMAPMVEEVERILACLQPRLERRVLRRCVFGIVGQVVFYRFAMPALLRMHGWSDYPTTLAPQLAAHITEFSLGGLQRLAARTRPVRRSRRPAQPPRRGGARAPA